MKKLFLCLFGVFILSAAKSDDPSWHEFKPAYPIQEVEKSFSYYSIQPVKESKTIEEITLLSACITLASVALISMYRMFLATLPYESDGL